MDIQQKLQKVLQEIIIDLGFEGGEAINLDHPDPKFGDYTTNIAMVLAKTNKQNPREVAEQIKAKLLDKQLPEIKEVSVAGPGFINITFTDHHFITKLNALLNDNKKVDLATKSKNKGKSVVVEYSSPNIAKPFTIGHLRSTIIGDAVANLLEATGWQVYRDNHVGDWGTQFGKQIYAIKTWGSEGEIEKAERPVKALVDLYVKFHEEAEKDSSLEDEGRAWFKKLEEGDPEARRLWEKCVAWSWKEFAAIYKKLDVHFTENSGLGYGESFFEDKMIPVIEELQQKKLLQDSEGAQLVFFPHDQYPPLMILKKDGATLYATRDLATDKFRLQTYSADVTIINEVGAEQSLYFQQLYAVEKMLGWIKDGQRVHVKHGLYRFKDQKMSTRKGNTIWLEDVLKEAEERAFSLFKHTSTFEGTEVTTTSNKEGKAAKEHVLGFAERSNIAEQVAMGALKWNDLKRDSKQDIVFDWDDILNMQGNSGPYMQYTYVRTRSILTKANISNFQFSIFNFQLAAEERDLLRLLVRFEEAVSDAATTYSPHILCTYLYQLAQAFNLFYQKMPILKAEDETKQLRLGLAAATGNVIKEGLDLLGIQAPEKM